MIATHTSSGTNLTRQHLRLRIPLTSIGLMSQALYLLREPSDKQTSGVLTMPSGREFYTLEQAWRNNKPFESCIPDGAYLIEPYDSPKFGPVYIVSGGTVSKFPTPKQHRWGILLHPANRVGELQGCIALGMSTSGDNLTNSKLAHTLFLEELAGNSAMLFVTGLESWN